MFMGSYGNFCTDRQTTQGVHSEGRTTSSLIARRSSLVAALEMTCATEKRCLVLLPKESEIPTLMIVGSAN